MITEPSRGNCAALKHIHSKLCCFGIFSFQDSEARQRSALIFTFKLYKTCSYFRD